MLLGGVFIVIGLMLLIRGWVQVYYASLEGQLATQGVYSLVRHPQYTGIMLAVFGQIIHRSEEHTSELQSLMRISYAVFCLKNKQINNEHFYNKHTIISNHITR